MCAPAQGPRFRVAHLSGWYGTPPKLFAAYVERVIRVYGVDLLTTTESKGMAGAVRKALGPEFRVQSKGEYLIITRRARFKAWSLTAVARLVTLSGRGYNGGRRFRVMQVDLRDVLTGGKVRAQSAHGPAGIEAGKHWSGSKRALVARDGFPKWGRRVKGQGSHRAGLTHVLNLDSNLDQHLYVWRAYLTAELGLPSIWAHHRPVGGTHGRRLIDTGHTNGVVSNPRRAVAPGVDKPHVLDHVGIVYDVTPDGRP